MERAPDEVNPDLKAPEQHEEVKEPKPKPGDEDLDPDWQSEGAA